MAALVWWHARRNEMEEFIRNYGIWILLVGVFFAMQWFGRGCGGSHRHGSGADDAPAKPGDEKKRAAHSGGCH
jgi:hypothetical protein